MQENKNKLTRAAVYVRVLDKTIPSVTRGRQEKLCGEFCKKNGLTFAAAHMFYDATPTIDTLPESRPGFQALLRVARNREFDVVVVYDDYRVSRNVHLFLRVIEELNQLGVDLSCATESLDTRTQLGRKLIANISASAGMARGRVPENGNARRT